jgi:large subunit ribosomal protein L29
MAKTKASSNNTMTVEELKEEIAAAKMNLQRLKFSHAVTPLSNPNEIKSARKEVARMLTALRQKELNA